MNDKKPHIPNMATASFAVLVVVTFFTALYMKGLNSGIPLYYDSLGYSATIGGTFVAVFTLSSTVMRLIGGQITDHFQHYKVLIASLTGLLVGVAIPAIFDNFYVVMASRVIQGASFALATNVMTVAVMGTASKDHIGHRVGIKGAGTSLGTMLGALVATWLLDNKGYHDFYVFYGVIMLLSLVAVMILKNRTKKVEAEAAALPSSKNVEPHKEDAKAIGEASSPATSATAIKPKDAAPASKVADATKPATSKSRFRSFIQPYLFPQVAPYLAISFARRVPKGFCIAFVLIFAKNVGIAMGATFFIAAGATTLACRLLGGKLFDSDKTWLLWPLISIQIIGFIILAIAPSFTTLIIAAICYGLSVGTTSPFIKTITAKATPKEHWGVVNGEVYFFGDLGKALGAFIGGLIIDATSKALVPEIALSFAIFTSAVTAISLLIGRHIQKHHTLAEGVKNHKD